MTLLQSSAFFCSTGSFPSSYKHDLVCPISKRKTKHAHTHTQKLSLDFIFFLFSYFSAPLQNMTAGLICTHLHFTSPFLFSPNPIRLLSSLKYARALHLAKPNGHLTWLSNFRHRKLRVVPPTSVSYSFLLLYWTLKYWSNPGTGLFFSSSSCISPCDVMISHRFKCHLYANDSQIYISNFFSGSRFIYST